MNTRKYPRTMQEAFGPHTSRSLYVEHDPIPRADKLILAGLVVFLAVAAIAVALA